MVASKVTYRVQFISVSTPRMVTVTTPEEDDVTGAFVRLAPKLDAASAQTYPRTEAVGRLSERGAVAVKYAPVTTRPRTQREGQPDVGTFERAAAWLAQSGVGPQDRDAAWQAIRKLLNRHGIR